MFSLFKLGTVISWGAKALLLPLLIPPLMKGLPQNISSFTAPSVQVPSWSLFLLFYLVSGAEFFLSFWSLRFSARSSSIYSMRIASYTDVFFRCIFDVIMGRGTSCPVTPPFWSPQRNQCHLRTIKIFYHNFGLDGWYFCSLQSRLHHFFSGVGRLQCTAESSPPNKDWTCAPCIGSREF